MKVASLFVYPVKSLQGIQLNMSAVSEMGFPLDRNWMVVNAAHKQLTQREHPTMALFHQEIMENEIVVKHGSEKIAIPFNDLGEEIETRVWGGKIRGKEVSSDLSTWFSDKMGLPVKLLHFSSVREVENDLAKIPFTDSAPYLLIGEGSIKDLSSRMDDNISINRFRPNIVISGTKPYEEDDWKDIKIGESRFKVLKKCPRCKLTNVNPDSGEVDKNVLKFLSSYRNENKDINFGVHLSLIKGNEIHVDDKVEILA